MKSARSISKLFRNSALSATALLLSACATGGTIPDVRPCVEIPFVDGAEGACVTTVSQKTSLVNAEDWAKERPFKIMIDAEDWVKIKLKWLEACRLAGPKCNAAVDSVDSTVRKLDAMARSMLQP